MLKQYTPFIVGAILAAATIGGVAHAALDSSARAANDPGSAAVATVVPYGTR